MNWACRALLGVSANKDVPGFQSTFHGRFGDFLDALRRSDLPIELHLANNLCLYASYFETTSREDRKGRKRRTANLSSCKRLTPAPEAGVEDFGESRIPAWLLKANRAPRAALPVLTTVETGTGKKVAASALHKMGTRSDGTRLLCVVDRGEVTRLGDEATRQVDLQLVCATHQDLEKLIEDGRFTDDLFFRISGFSLELSPLRQRDQLARLISRLCEADDLASRPLLRAVLKLMLSYDCPGNTRELVFAVQQIKTMNMDDECVQVEHLPKKMLRHAMIDTDASAAVQGNPGETNLKDLAARTAHDTVSRCSGNITLAARELGISRSILHRWLKKKI